MDKVVQIKKLSADGFGDFLPNYSALRGKYVEIRTNDPGRCADESDRRGIGAVNIYLAGDESVVCWPLVPEI